MCDQWMPGLKLEVSPETFHQLPRNASYKYEYRHGQAWLTPQPKTLHAQLELTRFTVQAEELAPEADYELIPATRANFDLLTELFVAAFDQVQPFGGADMVRRREAARTCLERTFNGGDGPWAPQASFLARWKEKQAVVGAILVTLLPEADPCEPECYAWSETPPRDLWEKAAGQPHLTWIIVNPVHKGHGLGTRLLAHSAQVLRRQGYRHLLSTLLAGNDSSMTWHWRNGFHLLPSMMSKRRRRRSDLIS